MIPLKRPPPRSPGSSPGESGTARRQRCKPEAPRRAACPGVEGVEGGWHIRVFPHCGIAQQTRDKFPHFPLWLAEGMYGRTGMSELHEEDGWLVDCPFTGHAVIAGYGVPGRAVGEFLAARGMKYCVIELNPRTVDRCAPLGVHMIAGDVREKKTLQKAGIERAILFAVAIPNDAAALEAVRVARSLSPTLHIMARCHYISAGIEAHRRGANEVVIEEQVVGEEFARLLEQGVVPMPLANSEIR